MKGIYKITNPNGSVYIGQSVDLNRRFREYRGDYSKTKKQKSLYRSFQKYGIGNHTFEVLQELPPDVSQEVMDTMERTCIQFFSEAGFRMLNIRGGGEGGGCHSEQTKILIKEKRKLQITTNETRKKMSETRLRIGCTLTDESKKKISIANSGEKNAAFGKPMLPHVKEKLMAAYRPPPKGEANPLYGRRLSEERKQRMKGVNGKWMLGRKLSPETIQKKIEAASKPIIQMDRSGMIISEWPSAQLAARAMGKTSGHISATCRGNRETAYGFIWKYKSDTK